MPSVNQVFIIFGLFVLISLEVSSHDEPHEWKDMPVQDYTEAPLDQSSTTYIEDRNAKAIEDPVSGDSGVVQKSRRKSRRKKKSRNKPTNLTDHPSSGMTNMQEIVDNGVTNPESNTHQNRETNFAPSSRKSNNQVLERVIDILRKTFDDHNLNEEDNESDISNTPNEAPILIEVSRRATDDVEDAPTTDTEENVNTKVRRVSSSVICRNGQNCTSKQRANDGRSEYVQFIKPTSNFIKFSFSGFPKTTLSQKNNKPAKPTKAATSGCTDCNNDAVSNPDENEPGTDATEATPNAESPHRVRQRTTRRSGDKTKGCGRRSRNSRRPRIKVIKIVPDVVYEDTNCDKGSSLDASLTGTPNEEEADWSERTPPPRQPDRNFHKSGHKFIKKMKGDFSAEPATCEDMNNPCLIKKLSHFLVHHVTDPLCRTVRSFLLS